MYKISQLEKNNFLNDDNNYGTIYVYEESLSEARFDRIPNSTLEIHIEGGEGNIPHIHICRKSGKNIIVRLKLLSNEYFREKDDRMYTLNSSERKALNSFLNEKVPYVSLTKWQMLITTWNTFNSSHMVDPLNEKQPDYATINEPK